VPAVCYAAHDKPFLFLRAGLQQFKQAALAYVLLAAVDRPLDAGQVAAAAEAVLQQRLQLQVCFNADEALAELRRFGLLVKQQGSAAAGVAEQQQQQQQMGQEVQGQSMAEAAALAAATAGGTRRPAAVGDAPSAAATTVAVAEQQSQSVAVQAPQQQQQQRVVYRVLDSREAQQVLQQYWAGLLRQRVRSILRAV
jgi:hypothetical protein